MNTDAEVQSREHDGLNRRDYADRVAERIVAAGTGPSVVFGLAGPWGGGKSSVLNMIREHIDKENNDAWTVAVFTPWSAASVFELTEEFYQCIASAMPETPTGKDAARKLASMAPLGAAIGKAAGLALVDKVFGHGAGKDIAEATVESLAEAAGKFRVQHDPFAKKFKNVSEAIAAAERNILVIVDDVDRLHADELLTLFKAVRLLGRFERVHYLLSYDEQTVLDVLQRSDIANGDRGRASAYLEKIIQYPFALPPLQSAQLELHMRASLAEVARLHAIDLSVRYDDRQRDPIDVAVGIIPESHKKSLTLRAINRLVSQVDVLLTLLGAQEIDFVDAILITYLRLHHRSMYDRLPHWRSDLVGRAMLSFSGNQSIDWKDQIVTATGLGVSNPLAEELLTLLKCIFPRAAMFISSSSDNRNRMCESSYFQRYFTFSMPVTDVADMVVRNELLAMCNGNQLPEHSVIAESLQEPSLWSPIPGKVRRYLDLVSEAEPDHAFTAACYIDGFVSAHSGGSWRGIISVLLERAVSGAENVAQAERYLRLYATEFGLVCAARTIANMPARESQAILDASRALRAEILDACKRDLSCDISVDDPGAPRLLDFIGYLDEVLWHDLRKFAQIEIHEQGTPMHELAGRFVRPSSPGFESDGPYIFESFNFSLLVPVETWNQESMPDVDENEQIHADGSLHNRIRFAAKEIQTALALPGSQVPAE